MLRADENETLTRVGPGTLMGNLLRRYWTPACLSAEIPEPGSPPVRVKLLGEKLVAFRDFGTEGRDAAEFFAMKTLTRCNWMQAMEGNIDSAHISWLHHWDGIDDIPDDGSGPWALSSGTALPAERQPVLDSCRPGSPSGLPG